MLLGTELATEIADKIFIDLQKISDTEDIKKSEVEKWSAIFVENNAPADIQPDIIDTSDFFEWYDH